jgi:hypothetical protein
MALYFKLIAFLASSTWFWTWLAIDFGLLIHFFVKLEEDKTGSAPEFQEHYTLFDYEIKNYRLPLGLDISVVFWILVFNLIRIPLYYLKGPNWLLPIALIAGGYYLRNFLINIDKQALRSIKHLKAYRILKTFNIIFALMLFLRLLDFRTGAECCDEWMSDSTGQGTCSGHDGVYKWHVSPFYQSEFFEESKGIFEALYLFDGAYDVRTMNKCIPEYYSDDDMFPMGRP